MCYGGGWAGGAEDAPRIPSSSALLHASLAPAGGFMSFYSLRAILHARTLIMVKRREGDIQMGRLMERQRDRGWERLYGLGLVIELSYVRTKGLYLNLPVQPYAYSELRAHNRVTF
jgi:hypothetical protein